MQWLYAFLDLHQTFKKNFPMAMVLSCVALVAMVGRSASAKINSAGVVLICPVIALPAFL